MSIRYYSTQRPVMPGSFPKPDGNKVLEIVNFDERTPCPDIGRDAWGYIEYEQPLDEATARNYELVKQGKDAMKITDLIEMLYSALEENGDLEVAGIAMGKIYPYIDINCPDSDSPLYIEFAE